jgi:hypothetical protein
MTHEEVNPYAAPKADQYESDLAFDDHEVAYRDGKTLMVRKGAVLPDRCIKCNSPADGYQFTRTLSWHRSVYYLVFLVSPLLYVLIYFSVRWSGKVTVGLCQRHRARRRWAITLGWLGSLIGLGLLIAAAFLEGAARDLAPFAGVGGVVLWFASMIGGIIGASVLNPTKIDKNFIWLKKVSPAYLDTFPELVIPRITARS